MSDMEGETEADVFIDLSGLKCPMPVLRTKKALSTMEPGQVLKVRTTDPASADDIPAFAKMSRHELIGTAAVDGGHVFLLRR